MKRRITSLALLAGLALGSASAHAADDVKIALSWLRNGQYSALMVADAKGFFAEEGIKVGFVDGGPGKNPVPLVGVGQAQFGVTSGSFVFQARLAPNPVDIVAIGALIQKLPYAYITLANPGDPEPVPKDLEGKRVGMQADGGIFLKALAAKNGLDLSKIKVETVLATAEPLLIGKIDYFTGLLHNQTYQIETEAAKPDAPPNLKGKTWKAISFDQYGVHSYGDVLFTSGETIRDNPDLVKRFVRAAAKGLQFMLSNPDETVKLVDAYPQQIERSDKLVWRMKAQSPLTISPYTVANGLLAMDPKVWEESMAFYKEAGEIPRVLPVDDVMTNRFNPGIRTN